MPALKHINNGNCPKCEELFNRYEGFNKDLKEWFQNFQSLNNSAHISCAGRGREEQEQAFAKGASRAHYGQSSHNYNCAIDVFVMQQGIDLYDKHWFEMVLKPNLAPFLKWYGEKGAEFYELPHIELKDWKELKLRGVAVLVQK